jgi:hypothetical protein
MSIHVVFFGGYRSSQTDMDLWRISAEKQRDDVKFDAFPYPDGAGAGDDDAVNGFKQFDAVIEKIEHTGADTLFIVGHSSGCAIANEVNSRVEGDHKNVTLVDLDGFAPSADKIKKSSVQAWSAEGDGGRGHSLHWAKGKKMYTAASATQGWSLHFSLVNTAATDAITQGNYKEKGYAGCIANLCWLPKKA